MFLPAPDESIWLGVLRISFLVPASRSLKDKRRVVAQVRDRIRARHQLMAAEVGHLDDHQWAVMSVASTSNDARTLRAALEAIARDIEAWGEARVQTVDVEVLRPFSTGGPHVGPLRGE